MNFSVLASSAPIACRARSKMVARKFSTLVSSGGQLHCWFGSQLYCHSLFSSSVGLGFRSRFRHSSGGPGNLEIMNAASSGRSGSTACPMPKRTAEASRGVATQYFFACSSTDNANASPIVCLHAVSIVTSSGENLLCIRVKLRTYCKQSRRLCGVIFRAAL